MVVEIEVIINSPSSFRDTLIIPDVDLFILERAPQPFGKDVGAGSLLLIHHQKK